MSENDVYMEMEPAEMEKESLNGHTKGEAYMDMELAEMKKESLSGHTKDAKDVDEANGSSDETLNKNEVCECCNFISSAQSRVREFWRKRKSLITKVILGVVVLLYLAYFIAACYLDYERARYLIIVTAVVIVFLILKAARMRFGEKLKNNVCVPIQQAIKPKWKFLKWIVVTAITLVVIVTTAIIIGKNYKQYRGLAALVFLTLMMFVTSHNPSRVRWRPVLSGMLINFVFAILILKTPVGLAVFNWLSMGVANFLEFTNVGSKFVFGTETYEDHLFAFKILPTIVFFSCVISLLYYIGVMQFVIKIIASGMSAAMGTSPIESLSCAGNIFVGQTEAPILIRPFLDMMTKSELHAVMTGGFATIAGGVLAAYIGFGVDPVNLLAASVMNAPMGLAMSKLFYPETEQPSYIVDGKNKIQFEKPSEQNLIEAAASGASQSIGLVANIAANLIAFLALLAFVNSVLNYLGGLVDIENLSFELICSYVFMPLSLMMGVDWNDKFIVAELIGTKIFLNEFVAYQRLGEYIKNRKICDAKSLSKHSEVIATYALCGFANLSSIGIQIGGIGAMAPKRRKDLANLVIRALIAGTVATFMTASIAGMLVESDVGVDSLKNCTVPLNETMKPNTTCSLASCCTDFCMSLNYTNNIFNYTANQTIS